LTVCVVILTSAGVSFGEGAVSKPEAKKRSAPATFSLRATGNAAGYLPMTIDGRQVFVSPRPFVSLADVESIEQADEAISIRVRDQAAERLSAAAKSPVAVFVGNELVGVVPATVSGGVISLASGTIPPSALGRFGSGATVGRAVPSAPMYLLTAREADVPAGGTLTVDVFVTAVAGLRAYQVALDAVGGDSGALRFESALVDDQHPNYVFAGQEAVNAADQKQGRVTSAMYAGSLDVGEPRYVGTYVFRASQDAQGTFLVQVRNNRDSQLRDAQSNLISFETGDPVPVSVRPMARPSQRR
jgi:hypothetical protein